MELSQNEPLHEDPDASTNDTAIKRKRNKSPEDSEESDDFPSSQIVTYLDPTADTNNKRPKLGENVDLLKEMNAVPSLIAKESAPKSPTKNTKKTKKNRQKENRDPRDGLPILKRKKNKKRNKKNLKKKKSS